jgi:hypothetical protein
MPLFAHSICLRKPRGHFVVDFVDAGETKRVKTISRRESFYATKSRILETAREDDMAVHPVPANHECGETHPDMKRDPRFLREDGERSVFVRESAQLFEDRADRFRFTGKVRRERVSPAGMRLIPIRERAAALRTTPERRFGFTHVIAAL